MYEKVKKTSTTCTWQCLSPSSKLSELRGRWEIAVFHHAWRQKNPHVGASCKREEELWIMKPLMASLLCSSDLACRDFTDTHFSLTWWQTPLSKLPLRFPSICRVLSIATSVRKSWAKELLLATCLNREKRISVIVPQCMGITLGRVVSLFYF